MTLANYNHELYHWGVKGMKWGIRRYQNKDGSLTPLGKKRAAQLESKYEKVTGKKMGEGGKEEAPKKKTIHDMSDDELRTKTNRLNLENNYLTAQNNIASAKQRAAELGPKKEKSAKEQIVEKIGGKLADEIPKKLITIGEKKLMQMLGIDDKTADELTKLTKENNILNAKKTNAELKDYFSDSGKAAREKDKAQKDRHDYWKSEGEVYESAGKILKNLKTFEAEYKERTGKDFEYPRDEDIVGYNFKSGKSEVVARGKTMVDNWLGDTLDDELRKLKP